jgi:hypothetical protein
MPRAMADYPNHINYLDDFIFRWDSDIDNDEPPIIYSVADASGHIINNAGSSDCISAQIVTVNHPSFFSLIEPGVRDLVRCLVYNCGWITYSSCEGHAPSQHLAAIQPRVVGLLSRSQEEAFHQRCLLYQAATKTNLTYSSNATAISVREVIITSDDAMPAKGVDIMIMNHDIEDERSYAELEEITKLFIDALLAQVQSCNR